MWKSDGSLAELQTDRLIAQVQLRQPALGLHAITLRAPHETAQLREARLLGLTLPGGAEVEEIHDSWLRGNDLVVVYAATARRALQPEIYWRSLVSADAFGLELIMSVKTHLLDDNPEIEVVSELDAIETWWVPDADNENSVRRLFADDAATTQPSSEQLNFEEPGSFLLRLPGNGSYIEMTHPTDFCTAKLAKFEHRILLQTPLFPENLEKGVIRRGRMRGWFVPSKDDVVTAQRLFKEFANSELPLTT